MTIVGKLELSEAVANGLVKVLTENLATVIPELNATFTDGVVLEVPVAGHVVPYITSEASLGAGTPLIGMAEMPAQFEDDLISSLTTQQRFYLYVVETHSDLATLTKLLRRYVRAIALAIQSDRVKPLEGKQAVLSREGLGVWSVMFEGTVPGPLLDRDPDAPAAVPATFLSWSGLIVRCKREEI